MRAGAPVFSAPTVLFLLIVGVASFTATVLLAVFGEDVVPKQTAGANTWSLSAIGHRAFADTLRGLDIPLIVSRHRPAETAGESGLLVIADPPEGSADSSPVLRIYGATQALVVLPKWQGKPDPDKTHWVESATLLPASEVQDIAREIVRGASVVRLDEHVRWIPNRFGVDPNIDSPQQLITSDHMRPIIRSTDGILLGEVQRQGARIWVLSDPDLIANHGLQRGENALLAVAVVNALRPPGSPVVFDETVHGFAREPDLWRELFTFPLVVLAIQSLIAAAILAWAAVGRFGAPVPAPSPLKAGKKALVDSTAGMLTFGGHLRPLVRRYFDVTTRDVARLVHAPRHLDEAGIETWLEHVGQLRGVRTGHRHLRDETLALLDGPRSDSSRLLDLARRIHAWKQAMVGR